MSWIDIFLSDGDPHRVYGADAKEALTHMLRLGELPLLWASYRRAGLRPRDQAVFLVLDVVRSVAYRKGFRDGATFRWPEDPQ
jgi:hypothetical protein